MVVEKLGQVGLREDIRGRLALVMVGTSGASWCWWWRSWDRLVLVFVVAETSRVGWPRWGHRVGWC